ncbi:hypothetical protein HpBGD38_03470 [Helicobacter pylori]
MGVLLDANKKALFLLSIKNAKSIFKIKQKRAYANHNFLKSVILKGGNGAE